eukprot:4792993-Pyramimonas_sp.AAC.1
MPLVFFTLSSRFRGYPRRLHSTDTSPPPPYFVLWQSHAVHSEALWACLRLTKRSPPIPCDDYGHLYYADYDYDDGYGASDW